MTGSSEKKPSQPLVWDQFGRSSPQSPSICKSQTRRPSARSLISHMPLFVLLKNTVSSLHFLLRVGRLLTKAELLEVYGPCLSTAGSDDWARHRKLLAAPFNENIMKFVWDESLHQIKSLLAYWDGSRPSIPSVQQDFQTVAINVLAATAFKKSYGFRGSAEVQDDSGSYRSTLATVLDNAILIMLIPYQYLKGPFVPKKLVRVGDAARAFKGHMINMLDEEIKALRENRSGSGGMMSSFVRALDVHAREMAESPELKLSKDGKRGLSIDEIFGNVFILNFAGYDTTANIIAFASYLLAINPEVQDWLAEEIAAVAGSSSPEAPIESWDYHAFFPQLKRCRAILLETLRLYPPIVAIPKWTAQQPQTLKLHDTHDGDVKTITIPPGVYTSPHMIAIHSYSKYWNDAEEWRPSRWIIPRSGQSDQGITDEELCDPAPNTYFPWSDGPQSCPGKKFIQVEAAAVFALLFRKHRISVVKRPGESDQAMKKRVLDCMNFVNMDVILKMQDPDRIKLVCTQVH